MWSSALVALSFAVASAACASITTNAALVATQIGQREEEGARTEVGVIGGAPYRIDVPAEWDGRLVVYCHGYGGPPQPFDVTAANPVAATYLPAGFAVAQSAYSAGGYAIVEGANDTEALRRYFLQRFGEAREVWITGDSLGGSIAMMLAETHATSYDGALPMCAPLGPALTYIEIVVFEPLVLFELWFPGMLPSPAAVPADYMMSYDLADRLARALDENPEAASALRARSAVRTNAELSKQLDLFTYIMGELEHRWGGNPFDNRDTIYTGFGDDEAVNDGVRRYVAHPHAESMAIAHYTPTGMLRRPMLAVRTVYDPLISAFSSAEYDRTVRIAGRADLFAQKYVAGDGHCDITPELRLAALEELRQWKKTGRRPEPGRLQPRNAHAL